MNQNIIETIKLFARLGITAFGGPAAHIAMMRQEVVARRKWMDDKDFLDLAGITNLIPGPNSTELAIHLGKQKAGWKGLLAAGVCFIVPAVTITLAIAWLYKAYGMLPQIQPYIYGIKPAIIAVILMAVVPLAKVSVKNTALAIVGIVVLALAIIGYKEIVLMFGAGLLFMIYSYVRKSKNTFNVSAPLFLGSIGVITNSDLFLTFLKIGAVLYGSGYVLFAFIDTELVDTGLLSANVLTDAIAVGQFTPGPVFSSVTFIGYQINGFSGAVAATIGVFLPSFVFVALLSRIVDKVRDSTLFAAFLDAVNVASVAVIAAICLQMSKESITNLNTVLIAVTSLLLLIIFPRINTAFIVVFGSLAGYLLQLINTL